MKCKASVVRAVEVATALTLGFCIGKDWQAKKDRKLTEGTVILNYDVSFDGTNYVHAQPIHILPTTK